MAFVSMLQGYSVESSLQTAQQAAVADGMMMFGGSIAHGWRENAV
jgi:hypothetical protein